jgi:hypothetical protein
MKVFWHSHQLGFDLGIDVERGIEASLDLIDDRFQRSPEVRDLFLAICRNWGRTALTLREMHELGVLGRYLAGVGRAHLLVQYDVYHRFTADQHSLLAVENLEALAPGQSAEAEGIAEVLNEVASPDLLMLGMLCSRHRQGEGPRPRGQGHPPHPRADRAHRADARGRRGGDPPRWRITSRCRISPSGATSTIRRRWPPSRRWWALPSGCACSISSPSPTCARWARA